MQNCSEHGPQPENARIEAMRSQCRAKQEQESPGHTETSSDAISHPKQAKSSTFSWLGSGVSMPSPPTGVTPKPGVAPHPGVAPGVAPAAGVAPPTPAPAGVSSHLERWFRAGVAPTAGVSPAPQPGVAPPSPCDRTVQAMQVSESAPSDTDEVITGVCLLCAQQGHACDIT